jgi:RNA recognition motif-containing protein
MNGQEVGTSNKKKIDVMVHKKLDQRGPATLDRFTNLVVQNLPADFNESKMKELFGKFGTINSVAMLEGQGKGFISFESHEQAARAIDEMNLKHKIND